MGVLLTFTGFGSYHKDSYEYDEYLATVYSMCQMYLRV